MLPEGEGRLRKAMHEKNVVASADGCAAPGLFCLIGTVDGDKVSAGKPNGISWLTVPTSRQSGFTGRSLTSRSTVMLTLYYYPAAISLGAHVMMEEGGEPYEAFIVDFYDEAAKQAYAEINPRCLVPALRLETGELITENVAVLPYLGKRFRLWPTDPINEAKALSLIGYFATATAAAAAQAAHPERHTTDPTGVPAVQAAGLRSLEHHLREMDAMLARREWFLDAYSPCDAYAFALYAYGLRRELPVHSLPNFTAFRDRMMQRPAVRRVVEDEGAKV